MRCGAISGTLRLGLPPSSGRPGGFIDAPLPTPGRVSFRVGDQPSRIVDPAYGLMNGQIRVATVANCPFPIMIDAHAAAMPTLRPLSANIPSSCASEN